MRAPGKWKFRNISHGIDTLPHQFSLPRHRHLLPYAIVVLAGKLEESGYCGRILASAGDALIHPALDCHANHIVYSGLKLIRLPWRDTSGFGGFYHLEHVDEVARVAERDVTAAAQLLESRLIQKREPAAGVKNDWPDLLLSNLLANDSTEIGVWAELNGLARETVSRGFAAAYGIAPSAMRAEARGRIAWLRITRGNESLSHIAADTGFADQAHMTRWIHRITGATPAYWRHIVPNKPSPMPS